MNIITKSECIECQNEEHCEKDNTKCCYLINHRCIIRETRQYKRR